MTHVSLWLWSGIMTELEAPRSAKQLLQILLQLARALLERLADLRRLFLHLVLDLRRGLLDRVLHRAGAFLDQLLHLAKGALEFLPQAAVAAGIVGVHLRLASLAHPPALLGREAHG